MFSASQIQEEVQRSKLLLAKTTRLRQSNAVFRTQVLNSQFRSTSAATHYNLQREINELQAVAYRYFLYSSENSVCNGRLMLADCLNILKTEKQRALYALGNSLQRQSYKGSTVFKEDNYHVYCIKTTQSDQKTTERSEKRQMLLSKAQALQTELYSAIDRLRNAAEAEDLVYNHCALVELYMQRQLADSIPCGDFDLAYYYLEDARAYANRLPACGVLLLYYLSGAKGQGAVLFDAVLAELNSRVANERFQVYLADYIVVKRKATFYAVYKQAFGDKAYQDAFYEINYQIAGQLGCAVSHERLGDMLIYLYVDSKLTAEQIRQLHVSDQFCYESTARECKFDAELLLRLLVCREVALNYAEYFSPRDADRRYLELRYHLLIFRDAFLSQDDVEYGCTAVLQALEFILDELDQLALYCACERYLISFRRENGRDPAQATTSSVAYMLLPERPPLYREIDLRENIRQLEEMREREFTAAAGQLLRLAAKLSEIEDSLTAVTLPDQLPTQFLETTATHAAQLLKICQQKSSGRSDAAELGKRLQIRSSRQIEAEMADFARFRQYCEAQFRDELSSRASALQQRAVKALERLYSMALDERDVIRLGDIYYLISQKTK